MTPIVVLVRPEIPENIGFVARTLACFGWTELRLVGALSAHSRAARRTVSGGDEVLEKAQAFADLPAAVADCHRVLGFSRRPHRDEAIHDLGEMVARFYPQAGGLSTRGWHDFGTDFRPALVFGPESQGLSAVDGETITDWVRIATPHPTLSLNLSHAVAIAVQAFAEAKRGAERTGKAESDPKISTVANRALMELGWENLTQALQQKTALVPARADAQLAQLRALWNRMVLSQGEAEFLLGVIKKLGR